MVDVTQILLSAVILVLTVMLSVIGVQVVYILREFRKTVEKMNKILDDSGVITESVSKPINMLSMMLMGLKSGSNFIKMLKKENV